MADPYNDHPREAPHTTDSVVWGSIAGSMPMWVPAGGGGSGGSSNGGSVPAVDPISGFGAVGDGITDDTAALQAAAATLTTGEVFVLPEGKAFFVTDPVVIAADFVTVTGGGKLLGGANRVLRVTGTDVKLSGVRFQRTTALGTNSTALEKSCVSVEAARCTVAFCDFTDAYASCLIFANGAANDSLVIGGSYSNSNQAQDSACIYGQAGTSLNTGIHVIGAKCSGDCAMGITIYDALRCRIIGNDVSGMRRVPATTWASGWTNTSGTIYSHPDNAATGTVTSIFDGSTMLTQNTGTPTAPSTNQWGTSGGVIYVNVGGDPTVGHTIEVSSVSGYGITLYSSTTSVNLDGNIVSENAVSDTDAFGIYCQPGTSRGADNKILGNTIINVMQFGQQNTTLPWAAIAVNGGLRSVVAGNTVTTSAYRSFRATNSANGILDMHTSSGITNVAILIDAGCTFQVGSRNGAGSAADFYQLPTTFYGSGTPLGVVQAPVGSLYYRTDGGTSTSLYVKESGTGTSGWVAK